MFNRLLLAFFLMSSTFATGANAFTDEAIKLAREWVIKNGEAIARGTARALVSKAVAANREFNDVETYNEKIDSLCAPGPEGLKGCSLTGGATFRSCGGIICGFDEKVAVTIEQSCGLLSSRNILKVAEFETSSCAGKAWGKIRGNPQVLIDVVGDARLKDPLNNVNQVAGFRKEVLLGILEVDQPKIVGSASAWDDAQVSKKLVGYLRYDTKGLIKGAVERMAAISDDVKESQNARKNPRAFAALITKSVLYPPTPTKQSPSIGTGRKIKGPAEGSQNPPASTWKKPTKPNKSPSVQRD